MTILTEKDQNLFESWTRWYYEILWQGNQDRRDMLKEFDLVVIDDPQCTFPSLLDLLTGSRLT